MQIIGINGSFIRKPASGIGQVSWHFIRQLLGNVENKAKLSGVKFIIYLEEQVPREIVDKINDLPQNIEFKVIKGWYKRDDLIRKILWERFWLPRQVGKDQCKNFFSPYQSATIFPKIIKYTVFVHDVIPNIFPEYLNNSRKKFYYWLVNRAIKKATKILTNSEFSRQDIARVCKIKLEKISVVYIDCDPIFRQEVGESDKIKKLNKYGLKLSDRYIFNFGGVDIRKNVERVIKAYGKLASEIENIPKLVIGGEFHKHLVPLVTDVERVSAEVVEKYQLDKNLFKTIGFVEQEDLPSLYQSAEVFIYPSLYEGFGMPILEGMVSKIPVVTSNTTSIPEVISESSGYLIDDPTNIDEIKTQLKNALTDTLESRQQKISLAFAESQKFSWEKFTEGVLKVVS
jgi:glycosyltransferase involved in cell wall biosynthesis